MKNIKKDLGFIINAVIVVVTGILNVYGYLHLPDTIAVQFSFSGDRVNTMSKGVYLLVSFGIVAFLAILNRNGDSQKRITSTLASILIFIANIVVIVTQL